MTEKEKVKMISYFINERSRLEQRSRDMYEFADASGAPTSIHDWEVSEVEKAAFKRFTNDIKLLLKL